MPEQIHDDSVAPGVLWSPAILPAGFAFAIPCAARRRRSELSLFAMAARMSISMAVMASSTRDMNPSAVAIDPATGLMTGGCDPRRDSYVAMA